MISSYNKLQILGFVAEGGNLFDIVSLEIENGSHF